MCSVCFESALGQISMDSISKLLHNLEETLSPSQKKAARLIILIKILNGLICIPNQYLPTPFPVTTTRSCHPIKLQQLYTRMDIYHYSFLPRTTANCNNLRIIINNINKLDLIQFKDFISNS